MADAPKILGTDTLRSAYPKLNSAIDNANEALTTAGNAKSTADTAKSTADTALSNSENTQTQLDTIVINGDSSVEAAQARVKSDGTAFTTLQQRLNDSDAQLAEKGQQVKRIEINLADYPRQTGETTDDGRFDRALADLSEGSKLSLEPFASYTINTIKFINKSNIAINVNHATINFLSKSTSNKGGEIGALNFHGELVGGSAIDYIRSINTSNQLPPAESPVLISVEPHEELYPFSRCSKVKTSNNSYFAVGDYIWLMGWSRANRMPYDANLFEPEIRKVAKVIAADVTYLYVDYYTPWTITCVDVATERSRAMKVKPLSNIKLENVKMVDNTTLATTNAPTSQELLEALSGISTVLVDGLTINGFSLDKPKYPALYIEYNRNVNLKDIYASNAQMWGGGQGYLLQMIGCSKGTVANSDSYKTRHTVDFSWSDNFKIEDSKGQENYERTFSIHGMCEHDLFYKRCKGAIGIGSGISYFPEIVGKVSIEDSDVTIAIDRYQYTTELSVKNSKVYYYEFPYSLNTVFENCDITASMNNAIWEFGKRGQNVETKMSFKGGKIQLYSLDGSQTRATGFFGVDYVTMENLDLGASFDASTYTTMISFRIFNAKVINLINVRHKQIAFGFNQNTKDVTINYKGSKFIAAPQSGSHALDFDTSSMSFANSKIVVNYTDSEVSLIDGAGYSKVAHLIATKFTNCFVVFNMKDNVFVGTANHTVHFLNNLTTGAVVSDKNNIIRYPYSGHQFSATNNTLVSA